MWKTTFAPRNKPAALIPISAAGAYLQMRARTRSRRSHLGVATPAPFSAVRTSGYGCGWREWVRGWVFGDVGQGEWELRPTRACPHPLPPLAPGSGHGRTLFRPSHQVVVLPAPFAAVRTSGYGGDWREWVRPPSPVRAVPKPQRSTKPCSSTHNASILCTPRGNFWTFRCVNYWERCIA